MAGVSGYVYSRLKQDENLRRFSYQRYFNSITWFDYLSGKLEAELERGISWAARFET